MVISSVPQTIPTTTRIVVTVEDRQGQTRRTTMGLQDSKTIVSRDKGNTLNMRRRVPHYLRQYFNYMVVINVIGVGNQITA